MEQEPRPKTAHQRLSHILVAFSRSTGLYAVAVDRHGQVRLTVAPGVGHCPHALDPTARALLADQIAAAAAEGRPIRGRCHQGCSYWVAPVYGDDEVAALVCDSSPRWELDEGFFEEIASLTGIRREDCQTLLEVAFELQRRNPAQVQAAAELLMALASQWSARQGAREGGVPTGQLALHQQAERLTAQLKGVSGELLAQRLLEREKQLLLRVRLRDLVGARAVLEDLLADWSLDLEGLKLHLQELITLISRTVMELGGREDAMLALSTRLLRKVPTIADRAAARSLALEVLQSFLAEWAPAPMGARHAIVRQVMDYLRQEYHRPELDLHTIARVVHLSPAYLSHLFSKEMHMTITQYLTSIRLEIAKKRLRESDDTVSEIADQVGYTSGGYFCKIFKKIVGMSPTAYRQQFRPLVATLQEGVLVGAPEREA